MWRKNPGLQLPRQENDAGFAVQTAGFPLQTAGFAVQTAGFAVQRADSSRETVVSSVETVGTARETMGLPLQMGQELQYTGSTAVDFGNGVPSSQYAEPVGRPRPAPPGPAPDLKYPPQWAKPMQTVTGGPTLHPAECGPVPPEWRQVAVVCSRQGTCKCAVCRHLRTVQQQRCPSWSRCLPDCTYCKVDAGRPTASVTVHRTLAQEKYWHGAQTDSSTDVGSLASGDVQSASGTDDTDVASSDFDMGARPKKLTVAAKRRARKRRVKLRHAARLQEEAAAQAGETES
jgi:hypothetical protein